MIKLKNGFNGEMAIVVPPFVVNRLDNDPIMSLLHITDIGYYPNAKYHYRKRNEPINQYVFIYCVKGTGWFNVYGQRYEVHADQYFNRMYMLHTKIIHGPFIGFISKEK